MGPVQVLSPLVPLHLCQRFSEQKLIKYIFLVLVVNWFTGHLLAPLYGFDPEPCTRIILGTTAALEGVSDLAVRE